MWHHQGNKRPYFAIEPADGQESVWDYPRPPALQPCSRRVVVRHGDQVIADSVNAIRMLETASPPTVYIPPADIDFAFLADSPATSHCEWKGRANYYTLAIGGREVAWEYREPAPAFASIRNFLCFYPGRVECLLGGEVVQPQAGEFYGGWVTHDIAGPFKGDPGTGHW